MSHGWNEDCDSRVHNVEILVHLGNWQPVKQDNCFFHWVTGNRVNSHSKSKWSMEKALKCPPADAHGETLWTPGWHSAGNTMNRLKKTV
jgi:hypothetical protein